MRWLETLTNYYWLAAESINSGQATKVRVQAKTTNIGNSVLTIRC